MGIAAVASAAGKGTGAISRSALGEDGPAAAATEETAALGAGLRAVTGDGGFGSGFIADAVAAVAGYPGPDCGVGAALTAGLGLAAAGCVGAAGLRSLA